MSIMRLWLIHAVAALSVLGLTPCALGETSKTENAASSAVQSSGPESPTTRPALRNLVRALSGGKTEETSNPAESDGSLTGGNIQVSSRGTVEMHVADMDLSNVLTMLSMQSRRNIIASRGVSGRVTANLYNVTLSQALDAILHANGCVWRERGEFIYIYTHEEAVEMDAAANPPAPRVFPLKYISADDASKLLQPLLSKDGKITTTPRPQAGVGGSSGSSGSSSSSDTGGNSMSNEDFIVVYDTPERLDAVARLLNDIDRRPKQVLIEATILRAQLNEDNALGVDFNIVGGVDFETLDSTSRGIVTLQKGDLPQPDMQHTTMAVDTNFAANVPNGGFTFGIIKDSVAVFIRALEQVTDTSVIANPKVLALNKQRGEVIVGRRDGYITTTFTETTSTQTVQFLETGTQLIFRPFIGDDGYVRMEIHPKDSTGGLTPANLPFENTTEVTTNIVVRDGHTILIGGLFREVATANRSQLPYLGNIPLAGMLVRSSRDNTQREEVIILLTVHVVKDDKRMAELGRKALDDVERYRVGMREGLLPIGRELLAQAHYRWAMEHLSRNNLNMALWDARIATHLNPQFLAAIELSETLTNKKTWQDDASSVRDFVVRQIQAENGITIPPYGRPAPPFVVPGKTAEDQESVGPESATDYQSVDPDAKVEVKP